MIQSPSSLFPKRQCLTHHQVCSTPGTKPKVATRSLNENSSKIGLAQEGAAGGGEWQCFLLLLIMHFFFFNGMNFVLTHVLLSFLNEVQDFGWEATLKICNKMILFPLLLTYSFTFAIIHTVARVIFVQAGQVSHSNWWCVKFWKKYLPPFHTLLLFPPPLCAPGTFKKKKKKSVARYILNIHQLYTHMLAYMFVYTHRLVLTLVVNLKSYGDDLKKLFYRKLKCN